MAGPKTIGAGIAATYDDDALSSSENSGGGVKHVALAAPVLLREEFHRKVDSIQFASRHSQVAGLFRTASKNNRVTVLLQFFNLYVFAHVCISDEAHAFGFHLRKPPVDDVLFQLEMRNAVSQQSTDAIRLLVHSYPVPGAGELLGSRQSRGSRADNSHLFAGTMPRRFWPDPALFKSALDDILFDLLDRDRRLIDSEHASRFARRRTDPSGELRKIIGGMQLPHGIFPSAAINQIVPVGDDVVHRTTGMTERDAAVHTTRSLGAQFGFRELLIDFKPVVDALRDRTPSGKLAIMFHEAGDLTHAAPAPPLRPQADSDWADSDQGCTAAGCGSHPALV